MISSINKKNTWKLWNYQSTFFAVYDKKFKVSTVSELWWHLFIDHASRLPWSVFKVSCNNQFCKCSTFAFVSIFLSNIVNWVCYFQVPQVLLVPSQPLLLITTFVFPTSDLHSCSVFFLFFHWSCRSRDIVWYFIWLRHCLISEVWPGERPELLHPTGFCNIFLGGTL